MNTKLQTKFLTMAAATLGLSLVGGGCAKKAEPAPAESGEAASGAESSCGGGSCGASHKEEHKGEEGVDPIPEDAEDQDDKNK